MADKSSPFKSAPRSGEADAKSSTQHGPKDKSDPPSWFHFGNDSLSARGEVDERDGRLNVSVNSQHKGYLARALGSGLHKHFKQKRTPAEQDEESVEVNESVQQRRFAIHGVTADRPIPRLNIVVMVIGSRGDIQPFLRIAMILRDKHHHRVRIATHPAFREFVEKDCGLEFFSVGGNPAELMAFMVKNPGLMPSFETVKKGEIGRRRDQMKEMFSGFWRSCIEASDGYHPEARPFVADAIISNPPVMIHAHCAERLGVPLHIMFTFPYSPTQAFPHPLANVQKNDLDESYSNFMSYPLVELMTWTGLGDLVNDTRVDELGLDPVSTIWAPGQLYRQKVPFSYMWSPSLCPKPKDWGPEINVAGYVFLELANDFEPPKDLTDFLDAGEPPIYIGFGSIVVDDAEKFTQLIFDSVKKAGVRAIVNKGWGGIGGGETPDDIFMIDNVPHDWLFPRCKAVVHHGGAGTTAIGLKCAKPTVIVPFFGDQPFWGKMCAKANAGAHECVPYKDLTADRLAQSIKECFSEESQKAVQHIADQIEAEGDGAENAVDLFHASLPLGGPHSLRGSVLENSAAAWRIKGSSFRLSPLTAEMMVRSGRYTYNDLRLLRIYPWADFQGAGGPISGAGTAVYRLLSGVTGGIAGGPIKLGKDAMKQVKHDKHRRSIDHTTRKSLDASKSSDAKAAGAAKGTKQTGDASDHKASKNTGSAHGTAPGNFPDQSTQYTGPSEPVQDRDDGIEGHDAAGEAEQDGGAEDEEEEENVAGSKEEDEEDAESTLAPAPTAVEVGKHAAYGIVKPLTAIAQSPMEILLGIGQGLHNLPRLYGDDTVRATVRVSGLKSGMIAAGSEFYHEGTDAFLGLFTQPYHGARESGALGAVTGFGKGIGGLVLKGSAAVINPLGLAMKGVEKEATKYKTPIKRIRAARIAQGQAEVDALSPEEREQVVEKIRRGFRVMQDLWDEADSIKKSGPRGRYKVYCAKRKWAKLGALESVSVSETALKANREGVPIEELMRRNNLGATRPGPDIEQRPLEDASVDDHDEQGEKES